MSNIYCFIHNRESYTGLERHESREIRFLCITHPWVTYLATYLCFLFLCRTNLCPTVVTDQRHIVNSLLLISEKCENTVG